MAAKCGSLPQDAGDLVGLHQMSNSILAGALPQNLLGELTALPQTP